MSALTVPDVIEAFQPLEVLPNAPELDRAEYVTWHTLLADEGVSAPELRRAVVDVLKREKFFPPPSTVLERVTANRLSDGARRRDEEARAALRAPGPAIEAAAPAEPAAGEWAPLEGLEVPPPRNPPPKGKYPHFGRVRLPDGRLDPRWPEIPGRDPAWRRRLLYDHGIVSYEAATASTIDRARKLSRRGDGLAAFFTDRETE